MIKKLTLLACAASFAALPLSAQEKKEFPAPGEIVAAAKAEEWVAIAPSDLLVMDLASDAKGKARRVVIQLIPAPFSQGWVGNIRKLAAAKFWDGTSINRVQDNYVVQWGDATEKKALPDGLAVVPESQYEFTSAKASDEAVEAYRMLRIRKSLNGLERIVSNPPKNLADMRNTPIGDLDPYGPLSSFRSGWTIATDLGDKVWPVHCYGMVGVGRNLSPDTGTGAELYTVIGHAPRHLDRNIALVGRVIEGIEHLSSLPRGTGALGFYEKEEERVPIVSAQLASEMEADPIPAFEYLSTESASFAAYADARANRRDPFFIPSSGRCGHLQHSRAGAAEDKVTVILTDIAPEWSKAAPKPTGL